MLLSIIPPHNLEFQQRFGDASGLNAKGVKLPPMPLFDGHCHLGRLKENTGHQSTEAVRICNMCEHRKYVELTGVVANFSHPKEKVKGRSLWKELGHRSAEVYGRNVIFAMSVHPKQTVKFKEKDFKGAIEDIKWRIQRNVVTVLGEVGLDKSGETKKVLVEHQRDCLKQQLKLAKQPEHDDDPNSGGLPVVLHIRSLDTSNASIRAVHNKVRSDCEQILTRDHPIYLHTYVGPMDVFTDWQRSFSNIKMGVSLRTVAVSAATVAAVPDLRSIILETDAPHFCPPDLKASLEDNRYYGEISDEDFRHKVSGNPFQVYDVARRVAAIRCLPTTLVAQVTTAEGKRFCTQRLPRH